MDVAAVAGLIGEGLGRERRDEPVLAGDRTDRVAIADLVVGGAQGGRVANGELLLPVAELGIELLDGHFLRLERGDDVVDHADGCLPADGAEAQTLVRGHAGTVFPALRQRPFRLEGGLDDHPGLSRPRDHTREEAARAGAPGLAVQGHHVRHHRGAVRRVGQRDIAVDVRHQPDLADRSQAFDGLELIEHVHRRHRDGEADAAPHALGQLINVDRLAADDSAGVAIEKAHEPHAVAADLAFESVQIHGPVP